MFTEIKKTLFRGFEIEASYHEELATTFKITSSPAWAHWLSIEQQYVPSRFCHETSIVQAECDAPDAATCLQWVAQARSECPHIVSAYLLWARGMTAQSAIACLLFQMLQQRPQVLSTAGLTMRQFQSANSSLPKLWSLFLHLVRALGGLMVYISIGSVGAEEFGIVERFVDLCRRWEGPPINVTLIHPFDDNFARVDHCVDIDEKYDVHPLLTTTDALHHVVLLRLGVHERISDTVRMVLWEALWREVRYAVIGIAVAQAVEEIGAGAAALAAELVEEGAGTAGAAGLWVASVDKWTRGRRAFNNMREQIQRYLNLVNLHLPDEVKVRLEHQLSAAIMEHVDGNGLVEITQKLRQGNAKPLTDGQRNKIWMHIQEAIRPGTWRMFSKSIRLQMGEVFEQYMRDPPETEREAGSVITELHRAQFGWNGQWRRSFSSSKELIVDGIISSISNGFRDVMDVIRLSLHQDENVGS